MPTFSSFRTFSQPSISKIQAQSSRRVDTTLYLIVLYTPPKITNFKNWSSFHRPTLLPEPTAPFTSHVFTPPHHCFVSLPPTPSPPRSIPVSYQPHHAAPHPSPQIPAPLPLPLLASNTGFEQLAPLQTPRSASNAVFKHSAQLCC